MTDSTYEGVRDLINREADLLDRRRWDEWLDLFTEDCVYWVPSWQNEDELVEDPELSVNMIYIKGRPGLEARMMRIGSGQSYASEPLARTSHLVSTNIVDVDQGATVEASATWISLSCDARWGKQLRGGLYEYLLRRTEDGLRIAGKKIVLLEDVIDGASDLNHIGGGSAERGALSGPGQRPSRKARVTQRVQKDLVVFGEFVDMGPGDQRGREIRHRRHERLSFRLRFAQ